MNYKAGTVVIIKGRLSSVEIKNTTSSIFFTGSDQVGMAASSVVAAAAGLSGIAAGLAGMSMEEAHEPVVEARITVGDYSISALLWSFPFAVGEEVELVAEGTSEDLLAYAVLSPSRRVIALYPHVSAGSKAHLRSVLKISALVSVVVSTAAFMAVLAIAGILAMDVEWLGFVGILSISALAFGAILFLIGLRIGSRFRPFVSMADSIFAALGWVEAEWIDLRRITKSSKSPEDPPGIGDRFFKY